MIVAVMKFLPPHPVIVIVAEQGVLRHRRRDLILNWGLNVRLEKSRKSKKFHKNSGMQKSICH
jgi:hypothetical protein